MKILCFNCVGKGLKVQFFKNDVCETLVCESQKHTQSLLVSIDKVLNKVNCLPSQVECVAVCKGPGSFTGIRVALSCAKAFCVANDCFLVSFDSFELLKNGKEDNTPCVFWGFANFFYGKFEDELVCEEIQAIKNRLVNYDKVICGEEDFLKLGIKINRIEPNFDMKDVVLNKVKNRNFIKLENLEALYVRPSQAEMQKKN